MPTYNEWWYPGHMAKAVRQLEEELPKIDVLVHLVDARLPDHTQIPNLDIRFANKPILLVLTKSDLADPATTKAWIAHFRQLGHEAISLTSLKLDRALLKKTILWIMKEKHDKMRARGVRPRPVRVVVVGMPNIGKSTFINQWIQKKVAKVENRPGVTRSLQWIRIGDDVELLDMPGIVFPQDVDHGILQKLAYIGVSPHHTGTDTALGQAFARFATSQYASRLSQLYELPIDVCRDPHLIVEQLAEKRSYKINDAWDVHRTYDVLLHDFREGKFGRISLEVPPHGDEIVRK